MSRPDDSAASPSAVHEQTAPYTVSRYKQSRHWAIYDPKGSLVCVALYQKGANEVVRRLNTPVEPDSEQEARS